MEQIDIPELHDAARAGDVDRLRRLLDGGARIGTTDDHDFTAIDYAARFGQAEAAEFLLLNGASAFRVNRDGDTSLGLAEVNGHAEVATLLRKHGAGRTGPVSEWFRLDKSVMSVAKLDDPSDDGDFWRSRTPRERLIGLEHLRRLNYGPAAHARLQRVLEFVERP